MAVGAAESRYLRLSHQLSCSVFRLDTVARHELAAGTALSANGCRAEAMLQKHVQLTWYRRVQGP